MKRYVSVLIMIVSSFVSAQVPVLTRLTNGDGTPIANAYLQWELKNCGDNFPVYAPSPSLTVNRKFSMRPDPATGIISSQIQESDKILCGNVASTAWIVTPYRDAQTPLQASQTYRILSTEWSSLVPFNPATALPMQGNLPQPGFQSVFANPTKDQNIVQPTNTKMNFFGVYDFTNATVLGLSGGGGGGGGTGDMLLNPPSDQIMQPLTGIHQYFDCAPGSAGTFPCYGFRKVDLSNIISIRADGSVCYGDCINGSMSAAFFVTTGINPAKTGLLRGQNGTTLVASRNFANTDGGDLLIGSDSQDRLVITRYTHILNATTSRQYVHAANFSATYCQPVAATGFDIDAIGTSPLKIIAGCVPDIDPGGDDCKTLNNAILRAMAAGNIDVDASGLQGDKKCKSNPMAGADNYSGNIIFQGTNFHIQSTAALWTTHSRVHIIGREGRSASGATSGFLLTLCNADSPACDGLVYNPTASPVCQDGTPATIPCPVITWSDAAERGATTKQQFATTLEGFTINCNGIANAVAIRAGMFPIVGGGTQKFGPQENAYIRNGRIENCGNGDGIILMPGTSNFNLEFLNILNENLTIADCSGFIAIDVNFDPSITANGPKSISKVTNTNGSCTIKPTTGFLADAGQVKWDGIHCENQTSECILIGSRGNVFGDTFINVNGVVSNSNSAVLRTKTGHTIGMVALNTVNINAAGYTIKDEYHGFEIRIDCQTTTAYYAFGTGVAEHVVTDAPCVPQNLTPGGPWITNVALTAGDVVRLVGGSSGMQITKTNNSINMTVPALGVALATISDTAVRVPVATYGIVGVGTIPGPTVGVGGSCTQGMYVYFDTGGSAVDGKVLCSATRPAQFSVIGYVLNDTGASPITAGATLPMFVFPEEPQQPVLTQCSGTGTSANPSVLSCAAHLTGLIKCAHAATGGTCQINTTVVKADSVIHLTGDTSITSGCDPITAPLYVSARSVGASFTFPVQTLGGTNGLCVEYSIIQITGP